MADGNMNGDVKSAAALGPHVRVNRSAYRLSTFRDQYLKVGGPPLLSCPVLSCPVLSCPPDLFVPVHPSVF